MCLGKTITTHSFDGRGTMSSPNTPFSPPEPVASAMSMEAKMFAMQELQRELATLHARLEYVRILLKLGVTPS